MRRICASSRLTDNDSATETRRVFFKTRAMKVAMTWTVIVLPARAEQAVDDKPDVFSTEPRKPCRISN